MNQASSKDSTMHKRCWVIFLCIALLISFTACNRQGSTEQLEKKTDSQGTQGSRQAAEEADGSNSNSQDKKKDLVNQSDGEGNDNSQEALLGPDATDEELLEVLNDETTVVTDGNYIEMVASFTEHTEEHSGQIYQMEGVYSLMDGLPYITRTIVNGEKRSVSGMPLKYVTGNPAEGDWIRVTGIVNKESSEGGEKAVLEVVVLQVLEEQGQAELSP